MRDKEEGVRDLAPACLRILRPEVLFAYDCVTRENECGHTRQYTGPGGSTRLCCCSLRLPVFAVTEPACLCVAG